MFLVRLGALNLLRNPRRSVLSLVAVVAGVAVFVLGQGLVGGLKENIIRAQIDTLSGHLMAQPRDYPTDFRSHPLDVLFDVDDQTAAWLDERAVGWTRRVLFSPDLIAGDDSLRVTGIGFDPETDASVFPRKDWKLAGTEPTSREHGVLVGKGPADLLQVGPGDWVTLRARTVHGAINALQVPVAGVVSTGSPAIDASAVLLTWDLSDELIRNGETTSHVPVRLAHRDDAEVVAVELADRLGEGVTHATWRSETDAFIRIQDIRQRILHILVFALLGMSASGIANTILMAAYERIREIGTLQAMGMTPAAVIRLFLVEGAMLGVVGGVLGGAVGGGLVYRWATEGIDMTAAVEGAGNSTGNVPFSTMLYLEHSPPTVVLGVVIGIVVALAASVYPAVIASRMQPADAVRA